MVSRERCAATAALDGADGGWMRPRLALSPVKSHGRTRDRTETAAGVSKNLRTARAASQLQRPGQNACARTGQSRCECVSLLIF